jgi:transcriptional antiterminator NusG
MMVMGNGLWYVVSTYSGFEKEVKANLENGIKTMNLVNKIFSVVIPSEEVTEIKAGKKKTRTRNYFPGYILVEMEMDDNTWYMVRNTPKVTNIIRDPLSAEEVFEIMRQDKEKGSKLTAKSLYDKGEHVKITDGPFASFSGVVEDINIEREKLKVMVTIFGRSTPVELDFTQVEKL